MNKTDFMKLFLKHPFEYKSALLSMNQRNIVMLVKRRKSMTTQTLASDKEISIASASGMLKLLHNRGYLSRKEVLQPSGGKEFVYFYELS